MLSHLGHSTFTPALIIVDFQEDFCPPTGALPVPEARSITDTVNYLLGLPFTLKIASADCHPPNHVSFAISHRKTDSPVSLTPSNTVITYNPSNSSESQTVQLWPVHCVQNTPGFAFVKEMNTDKIHHVVYKGQSPHYEMLSAFGANFWNPRPVDTNVITHLNNLLQQYKITHIFVAGLALEYCVKYTAIDASRLGYETFIVQEATRPINPQSWSHITLELNSANVRIISKDSREINRVSHISHCN